MRSTERTFFPIGRAIQLLILMVCAAVLSSTALAQKTKFSDAATKKDVAVRTAIPEGGPAPTSVFITNGTMNCKAYSQQSGVDNVIGGRELVLDFGGTYDASFDFRTYTAAQGNVELVGTTPTTPPGTVSVSANATTLLSFMTQKQITAVILQDASKTYVYGYDIPQIGYTTSGMNLSTNGAAITNIHFCFNQPLTPTAADATVSGRVLTPGGRAISGARITVIDAESGETFSAVTNPFGYYTVEGLEAGRLYTATVERKGYKFANATRVVSLTDSLADMDFVSNQ